MKQRLIAVLVIGICVGLAAFGVEAKVAFTGSWVLDKTDRSFIPAMNSGGGMPTGMPGGSGGGGGGFPGGGGGGGGYPGGGGGGGFPGGGGGGGGFPGGGGGGGGFPGGGGRRGGGGGGTMPGGRGGVPEAGSLDATGLTVTIKQTATELEIARKSDREGKAQEVTQKFTLDGKECQNLAVAGGGEYRSKTKWHNKTLVIEGTQQTLMGGRAQEIHVKEEFSLSKDGQVLKVKTIRRTPIGELVIKQTFKKSV